METVKGKLPEAALAFFRQQGKAGGKLAAKNMSPEERAARAKKASAKAAAKRSLEAAARKAAQAKNEAPKKTGK